MTMDPTLITSLFSAGTGGVIIAAFIIFSRDKKETNDTVLDRLDKIVDRHLASEESSRKQIADQAAAIHGLFDRVIAVCNGLGTAIQELSSNTRANEKALQELSSSTKANEKAIQDLRQEFRSLGGPQSHRALGHDEAPPFGKG